VCVCMCMYVCRCVCACARACACAIIGESLNKETTDTCSFDCFIVGKRDCIPRGDVPIEDDDCPPRTSHSIVPR